ncbi:hypothetical protein [Corynebacterium comes]|uniref:Secreted protein n=1 Tax=Corynebacterium comes TaxID=2675218 RepID=A0A6B8W3R3_9CORY|nr:hypothetical protein [Corynebacterium comes]QGU04470.1 hypothetical protein CETAM_06015 [Corynebacterium comes]
MRRTFIALGTAATLTLGVVPAAQAAPSSQLDSQVNEQVNELPTDMRLGSSGARLLSSNPSEEQMKEGAALLGRDWLIGFVAVAVLGTVIQAVSATLR